VDNLGVPTDDFVFFSDHCAITNRGAFCITRTTSGTIVQGNVLSISQTSGDAILTPTTGNEADMPFGVAVKEKSAGVWWVAVAGTTLVLPENAVTAAVGYVCYAGVQAGRASQSASIPGSASHFREIGHFVEDGTGNGVATLAVLHFN
jgi:hypothetical protein